MLYEVITNLLLGTIDPLLAGLSQEAAHIISPGYEVSAAANYYFLFVSTFIIAVAGKDPAAPFIPDAHMMPGMSRRINQQQVRNNFV